MEGGAGVRRKSPTGVVTIPDPKDENVPGQKRFGERTAPDECRGKESTSKFERELVGELMNKKLFAELVESVKQMNEIVQGERVPSRRFEVNAISVKKLRSKLGLSQLDRQKHYLLQSAVIRSMF
jgi:hypothetical protein